MKKFNVAIAALTTLALLGCGEEYSPAASTTPVPRRKAAAPAAQETTVSAPTYSYSYSPVGKRDPFRSPAPEMGVSGPVGACSEPLCQWDLEQFTLVAVVTGDSNPLAMVQDPQGRGYIVRRATRIGKQGGKVAQILRDQLIINEEYIAPDGKRVVNPVSLKIKQDEGFAAQLDFLSGRSITQ